MRTSNHDQAKQVRQQVLEMIAQSRKGHIGGALSCVEILVALYNGVLRHRPNDPLWPDREILSIRRTGLGSQWHEGYSEIAWKPV